MPKLNKKTIQDIRNLNPCYDPSKYLSEDWHGTALDILRLEECPIEDRIWVVCHQGWIDDRTLRLFAVWCGRTVIEQYWDNPNWHSIKVCNIAEQYALGKATIKELALAWSIGGSTAAITSGNIAWFAAWTAASTAELDINGGGAWNAARCAAWGSVETAELAGDGTKYKKKQIDQLINMLTVLP